MNLLISRCTAHGPMVFNLDLTTFHWICHWNQTILHFWRCLSYLVRCPRIAHYKQSRGISHPEVKKKGNRNECSQSTLLLLLSGDCTALALTHMSCQWSRIRAFSFPTLLLFSSPHRDDGTRRRIGFACAEEWGCRWLFFVLPKEWVSTSGIVLVSVFGREGASASSHPAWGKDWQKQTGSPSSMQIVTEIAIRLSVFPGFVLISFFFFELWKI